MEQHLLTTNIVGLRYEDVLGRQFAIAPITILRAQVLDGSKGALYYPKDEIAKNYQAWNGMPLVVYHPSLNGANVSARIPEMMKTEIGRIYKASINSDGDLSVEGWFDVDMVKKVDNRVWNDLVNGNKIEVSTGLFTDNDEAQANASYKGKAYTHIARNYRPDHLAILPDQVGACSIKEGCGVFNQDDTLTSKPFIGDCPNCGSLDHNGYTCTSCGQTLPTQGDITPPNQYPEACPYCDTLLEIDPDSGKCNRCGMQVDPITNQGSTMDRTKLIEIMVNNCACYSKDKTAATNALKKMSDEEFKKAVLINAEKAIDNEDSKFFDWMNNASDDMKSSFVKMMKKKMMGNLGATDTPVLPKKNATPDVPTDEPANPDAVGDAADIPVDSPVPPKKKPDPVAANNMKTEKEYLDSLPPSLRDTITNAKKITDNEKRRIATILVANVSEPNRKTALFNKLILKDLNDLQEQLEMLPTQTNNQQSNQSSNGMNWFGAVQHNQVTNRLLPDVSEDLLMVPTINWAEDVK